MVARAGTVTLRVETAAKSSAVNSFGRVRSTISSNCDPVNPAPLVEVLVNEATGLNTILELGTKSFYEVHHSLSNLAVSVDRYGD
jgi:hypothetical protein